MDLCPPEPHLRPVLGCGATLSERARVEIWVRFRAELGIRFTARTRVGVRARARVRVRYTQRKD